MISLKSEVTKKLLYYFFINPNESLYVNEVSRKLRLDKRNLVRKIKELEREGILRNERRGNLKLYSINKNYPLYKEYRSIILKSVGFEDKLKGIIERLKGIKKAIIYGSYAQDRMDVHSDIDLLVIGNHDIFLLQRELNKIQKEMDREINIVNIDEREFKKRVKAKDPFILEILDKKHIEVIR